MLARLAGRSARALGVLAVVAFIALLAYGLLSQAPDTGIDDALAQAETPPAPDFELPLLERGTPGPLAATLRQPLGDGRIRLSELRGTPVVVNFWASWCVPCQTETPLLERAWRRARQQGVLFVGLNMQDIRSDARAFMAEFGISYLNVRDQDNDVAREYGATGLPETFFITDRGNVAGHVIGAITPEQLSSGVAAARSRRPLVADSGGDRRSLR